MSKETKRKTAHGGRMGPPGAVKGEKPKHFKDTMKKLFKYLQAYKVAIFSVVLFSCLSVVMAIAGPKILGKAIDKLYTGVMEILSGTGNSIDYSYIARILLILVGLYVISSVLMYIQGFIMTNVSMEVTYKFRKDISEKINRMPLKYFDKTTHGDVLSRITNDVDTISQSLNQSLSQIITSVTTIIGILIMMLTINFFMTIVSLVMVPLSFIIIVFIMQKSQKYFVGQQKHLGEANGHVEEMYGGHTVMKAFNGEKDSIAKFDKHNKKLYGVSWKAQFYSGIMMPMMLFLGNFGYVIICILGGYLAANDKLTIGGIQAFIQYVRQFNQPISQVANISNVLQQTAASAERVFEFLAEEEEASDNTEGVKIALKQGKFMLQYKNEQGTACEDEFVGAVTFENVKFGYNPEKIIINDFSAQITPGQKVAIVGPTGAGKTTIVKLLMRFYDVTSGRILIDGHDIKDFTRHDLRSLFGMVLQDTWLYNDTIMDNIRYGKLDATDEEVIQAAKSARVHHFVKTLSDGYNVVMNEESTNISYGQKQLLTIARAILADPEILILDEATSSVDTKTEMDIQKAMKNLMHDRTSFVIAHRLSTIRDADLILVMKDGDIVEQGNHDDLLEKNGFYANLYNSQFDKDKAS